MEQIGFKGYGKIEENIKSYKFSEDQYKAFAKTEWVVTEKVHGANMCVIISETQVYYAKRKELLSDDDNFFGYKLAMIPQESNFLKLFKTIKKTNETLEGVYVYGELFGGGYPHSEVEVIEDLGPIQTGVYYSNTIHYCVFDIAIKELNKEREYLNFHSTLELCKENNLLTTPVLFKGKYNDAMGFNPRFITKVPSLFQLPAISDNFAEGIVVRPLKEFSLEGNIRPLVKIKIDEFSEVKYNQATNKGNEFGNKLEKTKSKVFDLITVNRLNNAISKIGRVKKSDSRAIKKLEEMYIKDIMDSIKSENISMSNLSDFEQKQIVAEIQNKAKALINDNL